MQRSPKDNFVLLETNRFDKDNRRSFLFINPVKIISPCRLKDVKQSLLELEDFIVRGHYAAGFISYEAGFAFEDSLKGLDIDPNFPLLWFGIYKDPDVIVHKEKIDLLGCSDLPYAVKNIRANITKERYVTDIKKIKDFIRKGDTYQVNYTFKYKFDFYGSLYNFYEDLKAKQSVSYSAFIKTPEFSVLSLSPELFFRKNKDSIEVRPMKGTLDRGKGIEEDRRNMAALKESLKNRSENVMIVDLLRSDLGRISKPGSVKTEELFRVERYETLFQMISIIRSAIKKDVGLYDLFKAIFPSGSVTGAPKISTMNIINSLEKEPRRVYTGSVGFIAPTGEAVFNVAIRTLLIDNKNSGEMGIGSGIVYDSDPYGEFDECRLKANFITRKKEDFRLIETILWRRKKGYFLLKPHLDRLSSSAEYFNFRYDELSVKKKLKGLEKQFKNDSDYRVRLLLGRAGRIGSSFSKISNGEKIEKVRFSNKKTSTKDIFLYHKTTKRDLYDREYKKWKEKGYFDVIFTNEKDQVTEGAISNIIIKKKGFYYTPPLECGFLDGVFRKNLLKNKRFPLREKILHREDVERADELYMVNSVRGMTKVRL